MIHTRIEQFVAEGARALGPGPVALIFAEDATEIESTLRHHRGLGFRRIVLFSPPELVPPEDALGGAAVVHYDPSAEGAVPGAINTVIDLAQPGTWLYYCYNAEYLFFPFCETRTVGELLAFHAEERRAAMLGFVIDLYAGDLESHPDAVAREAALMDRSGYYALSREGPAPEYAAKDRQLDFYGGLRWRFEEHVPWGRRRIDRTALFRARRGLRMQPDHTLSDEEMNTYACPWHNNVTAGICSFRTAKALRSNPGSRAAIRTFRWHNSVPFEWRSQQLLDLGLIEPGQWF